MRKYISECCESNVKVKWCTTRFFVCEKCNKPCNHKIIEVWKKFVKNA